MGLGSRLYHGQTRLDIVGRRALWFGLSGFVIAAGLLSLGIRQLNLGIDFEGGAVWELPAEEASVEDVRSTMEDAGIPEAKIQTLESDEGVRIRVQTESLGVEREQEIGAILAESVGIDAQDVSLNSVGPSWGEEITSKALRALVFFLIAITIYVTFRFEFKMAVATLVALFHDILVTIGVYSITGFEVTPATVIAILTILGYSIYDGIVVFDKVDENTRLVSSTNRVTYSDMVNLSLNQTLMRSLNTQITALLPMLSLLIVGSLILGATTLQEFAVALLVGQASGAYSSLFIASPVLAMLKEREPRFKDVRRRIEARAASSGPIEAPEVDDDVVVPAAAARVAPAPAAPAAPSPAASPSGPIPPRPRKKTKRR
jgi:preprotein translocase subunit SecF